MQEELANLVRTFEALGPLVGPAPTQKGRLWKRVSRTAGNTAGTSTVFPLFY